MKFLSSAARLLKRCGRKGDPEEKSAPDAENRQKANQEARGRIHLTRDEVHQLMRAAKKRSRYGERDALMIRLAFEHGLRVSELVGLSWGSVDLKNRKINIKRVWGSESGAHKLQKGTAQELERYQRHTGRSSGFIFVNERGGCVSTEGFRNFFARLSSRELGMRWHPHALRHACGVHLVEIGLDVQEVQEYMGHAQIHNSERYTDITEKSSERVVF